MQPSVLQITQKEAATFFSSPIAYLFFGAFLLLTLFIFFWVETFFARNIADVQPLFDWMPILSIFLVAALTMRTWSEERRSGTLEFLLTQPLAPWRLVLGKFFACLFLVGISLLLTLPLPITVSLLGNLDWEPVFGAYLATLLLAAAYIAIGLAVSVKTDNQIVSLIVTVLICSGLYLLGSETFTSLFNDQTSEFLKALGTGSRFQSITRGVIDLRDLYYYVSIVGVFIFLNIYFLEVNRWSNTKHSNYHKHWNTLFLLLILNVIAVNFWLSRVHATRIDITEGQIYSISDASRNYLEQLQEPLLIRGYFSAKTHPLLAPLIPQLKDLIHEYQIAGAGKIRIEFINPQEHPELEKQAGQKYGIKPVPFQITDKYQASLVNSYFNVVIQYGDQHQTLGFQDFIEVKSQTESDIDVQLRNPEYEITRSIKKALFEYQSGGNLFANLEQPLKFTGYFSADEKLPEALVLFKNEIQLILEEFNLNADGLFEYQYIDPEADAGKTVKMIQQEYGFSPMQASLLNPSRFYFYMLLESGNQTVQASLPKNLDKQQLRLSIEAAIKRFGKGYTKTVAIYAPPLTPPNPVMRQMRMPSGKQFRLLIEKIQENHKIELTTLAKGSVPENADFLMVLAPTKMDDKQLFAIDQFLMKGGSVLIATSSFAVDLTSGSLVATQHTSGIEDWLQHHGITIDSNMVMDPQNTNLPIPIQRNLSGFSVQEIQMVEYPYFIDIRESGLSKTHAITASLGQLSMNWASPISFDSTLNKANRTAIHLVSSSPQAWLSDSLNLLPDFDQYPRLGFSQIKPLKAQQLVGILEGQFESYFKDKNPPTLNDPDNSEGHQQVSSIIEKSPESARIIILGSNEFLTDQNIQLAASAGGMEYLNSLQLIENAVDWSLEDSGLLSIRSRSHYARTLIPMTKQERVFWEYINYLISLLGLLCVYLSYRYYRRKTLQQYQAILQQAGEIT